VDWARFVLEIDEDDCALFWLLPSRRRRAFGHGTRGSRRAAPAQRVRYRRPAAVGLAGPVGSRRPLSNPPRL